jgi:hypothetical protein
MEKEYPFGLIQKELDETVDKIKEGWKDFSDEPINYDEMPDEYFYGIFGNLGIMPED